MKTSAWLCVLVVVLGLHATDGRSATTEADYDFILDVSFFLSCSSRFNYCLKFQENVIKLKLGTFSFQYNTLNYIALFPQLFYFHLFLTLFVIRHEKPSELSLLVPDTKEWMPDFSQGGGASTEVGDNNPTSCFIFLKKSCKELSSHLEKNHRSNFFLVLK